MQKALKIAALCLVLSGCGSKAEMIPTDYYVLGVDDAVEAAGQSTALTGPQIALTKLKLAPYLGENGVAMIQDGSRINIANHALWGEPLANSIPRALRNDFRAGCGCPLADATASGHRPSSATGLQLEIDRFGPTDQGEAVLTGRYMIEGKSGGARSFEFNMKSNLQADGYREAVMQMRKLLSMLASDIQTKVGQ